MENHQPCFEQNWWLNGILCLLTIDYFTYKVPGKFFYSVSSSGGSWARSVIM